MPPKTSRRSTLDSQRIQETLTTTPQAPPQAGPQVVALPAGTDPNDWGVPKKYVAPPDQLHLTAEQLAEVKTKILKANNPNAPQNIARYNHKEKTYKFEPTVEQTALHYADDGKLIHCDGPEAKRQAELHARKQADLQAAIEQEKQEGADEAAILSKLVLKNQFNCSSRATQTSGNPAREREIMTEPPPGIAFGATATQWEIYDTYVEDDKAKGMGDKKAKIAPGSKGQQESVELPAKRSKEQDVMQQESVAKAVKIMERMVNQNTNNEITMDYKHWEDQSDLYNEDAGSLLPLWKFANPITKKKTVTCIRWNPTYNDLFAVAYGSYDFLRQGPGLVCCFSLKNPSSVAHPEFVFSTSSGVMCLDFHPEYSSLLALGLYDGTVMVFDVRQKVNRPIFQSNTKSGKHTDPVWEVHWASSEKGDERELNFFSISSDGRVTNWVLAKNELQHTNIMELELAGVIDNAGPEVASLAGLAGGTCFDFSKANQSLFLVGTEEGKIHLCSQSCNSQSVMTYSGHNMAVYTVRWNTFHDKIFISASADWTVKLWHKDQKSPLMSFDLGSAVSDVAWAPYSATVFAAVTSVGKVNVYDINQNNRDPLCEQLVVKKAKLTHIVFNQREPIILVGDDRGSVISLKLSPNLRKNPLVSVDQIESGKLKDCKIQ